ncbi:hypothetical protein D918_08285 [Trichuris suis]|nr:hypothetical protein D918_08285 [Trichuris suis]
MWPRESIDDFTEDLRCIALQVDKGDRDTMEQFVLGLRDRAAQQHLVDGESMTLDEAVQAAKQFIARQLTVREMRRNRPSLRGSAARKTTELIQRSSVIEKSNPSWHCCRARTGVYQN